MFIYCTFVNNDPLSPTKDIAAFCIFKYPSPFSSTFSSFSLHECQLHPHTTYNTLLGPHMTFPRLICTIMNEIDHNAHRFYFMEFTTSNALLTSDSFHVLPRCPSSIQISESWFESMHSLSLTDGSKHLLCTTTLGTTL